MKLKLALKQIEESLDSSKEYNWTRKGKKIILEEVSTVSPKVWTIEQEKVINQIQDDIKELKQDVKGLRSDINLIINHLGIKR